MKRITTLAALALTSLVASAATPFPQPTTTTWTDPNAADVGVTYANVAIVKNGVAGTPVKVNVPFAPYTVTIQASVGDTLAASVALCNANGCNATPVVSPTITVSAYKGVPAAPTNVTITIQ